MNKKRRGLTDTSLVCRAEVVVEYSKLISQGTTLFDN